MLDDPKYLMVFVSVVFNIVALQQTLGNFVSSVL